MARRTDDPIRDANWMDRHEKTDCYCYMCERRLYAERIYNIRGTYYCAECMETEFGEEI